MLTKDGLAKYLASIPNIGLTYEQSKRIVSVLLERITMALHEDQEVRLNSFGTFSVKKRAERKGRNPRTGAELTIPQANVVKFKPAKHLRDLINDDTEL